MIKSKLLNRRITGDDEGRGSSDASTWRASDDAAPPDARGFGPSRSDPHRASSASSPLLTVPHTGLFSRRPRPMSYSGSRELVDRLDAAALAAAWYRPHAPLRAMTEALRHEPGGAFVVVNNPARVTDFVLLYRHGQNVQQADIVDSGDGLRISTSQLHFQCLGDLIAHYSAPGRPVSDLPCMLRAKPDRAHTPTPPTAARRSVTAPEVPQTPRPALVHSAAEMATLAHTPSSAVVRHSYTLVPPSPAPVPRTLSSPNLGWHAAQAPAAEAMYQQIEVDELSRQRLLSVSRGQAQLRHDRHIDEAARTAPWNFIGHTKERALSHLLDQPPGAFVVRGSDEYFGALSVVTTSGLYHAHIEATERGLHLKKSDQYFATLSVLISYYRQPHQDDVPLPLAQFSTIV